jgi:putative endonuclease
LHCSIGDKEDFSLAFYTYILQCADRSLYTGWTDDVDRRLTTHNSGKGAKYTKARLPVTLLAHWRFETKNEAMSFEWHIKQLPRSQKLALAQDYPLPRPR